MLLSQQCNWPIRLTRPRAWRRGIFRKPPMPHCSVCEQTVADWLPHPHLSQRSEFMTLMQTVGSDLTRYQCPACGCTDTLPDPGGSTSGPGCGGISADGAV